MIVMFEERVIEHAQVIKKRKYGLEEYRETPPFAQVKELYSKLHREFLIQTAVKKSLEINSLSASSSFPMPL
jgi:hypothetical protein